jgi:hypothetical protein
VFLFKDGRLGEECKRVDAPRLTPSMCSAMQDLQINNMAVVYPRDRAYALGKHITTVLLATHSSSATKCVKRCVFSANL